MREVSSEGRHYVGELSSSSPADTSMSTAVVLLGSSEGYHSEEEEEGEEEDSDSTVMMSGNSPFVPKSARYNFLQRSGESHMSCSYYAGVRVETSTTKLNLTLLMETGSASSRNRWARGGGSRPS